jgi:hypothetical protein
MFSVIELFSFELQQYYSYDKGFSALNIHVSKQFFGSVFEILVRNSECYPNSQTNLNAFRIWGQTKCGADARVKYSVNVQCMYCPRNISIKYCTVLQVP